MARQHHVQGELLRISQRILRNTPYVDRRKKTWANVHDFHPGLGIVATYAGITLLKGSKEVYQLTVFDAEKGPASMVLRPDVTQPLYEEPFSEYFLQAFQQYDAARARHQGEWSSDSVGLGMLALQDAEPHLSGNVRLL